MNTTSFIPYQAIRHTKDEMIKRVNAFYQYMEKRRSWQVFSDKKIPRSVIENIIMTASMAPSGAHKQPWTFCAVSELAP